MTAVQQYWIVENDAMLVSNITPVPVADEDRLIATGIGLGSLLTDDTPLDGYAGTSGLVAIEFVTVSIPEYDNPYDTADRYKGKPGSTFTINIVDAVQQYSNPYDVADRYKGRADGLTSLSVVTVVVQYNNLYDPVDKYKGAPGVTSLTIT